MKKVPLIAIAICVIGYSYFNFVPQEGGNVASVEAYESSFSSVQDAYQQRRSDVQVQDYGVVVKVLADDNKGSRHQKFILKLASGNTILVAHNIDLAPRVDGLRKGSEIAFFGEYEWNEKGGVVHWTHHDPAGKHLGGWLKHNGKRYQ